MWIKDMFFFHELPKKINIWSAFIIVSPYLGPFMASFVVWRLSWRWVYWIYAILNGIGFVIIVLFVDETFYNRNLPVGQQPPWKSRPKRLIGIEKHGRRSLIQALARPLIAITKAPVVIITTFYFLNFAWTIGVNATLATWLKTYYHFDGKATGELVTKQHDGDDSADSFRTVLLRSDHWMRDWRGGRTLVARPDWQDVHQAPSRQD